MNRAALIKREEAFWEMVQPEPNTGCWLWAGSTARGGYGQFMAGRRERAHRISYELVHGPIPEGASVLHRCDMPACVNPEHLFLGTQADNMADMVRKGRAGKALTASDVVAIRQRYANGERLADIAADYGVVRTTIGAVARGETWAELPSPIPPRPPVRRGERSGRAKLTTADVLEIRRRAALGVKGTMAALAREFGIAQQSVSLIVQRKNWAHVPEESSRVA